MTQKIIHHKQFLLFFSFLIIKGLIWTWTIPPFFSPDEYAHFAYTQYIIEEKMIPVNEKAGKPTVMSMSEEVAMAQKIWTHKIFLSTTHIPFPSILTPIAPEFSLYNRTVSNEPYTNPAAVYSPIYYAIEAIPYILGYNLDIFHRMYFMRMFSLIFSLITVIFAYKIAFLMTKERLFSFVVAGIISLMPSVNASSFGGINNDAILIAFAHILMYILLRFINQADSSFKSMLTISAMLGLTLLTKTQAIIFFPLTIGVYIFKGKQEKNIRQKMREVLTVMGISITIFFIFSFPTIHSVLKGVQPINIAGETALANPNIAQAVIFDIIRRLDVVFGFWLQTEFFDTLYPISIIIFLTFLSLSAIVGATFAYLKKNINIPSIPLVIAAFFLLEIFYTLLYYHTALTKHYYGFPGQGRYYFILLANFIIIFLLGLRYIISKINVSSRSFFLAAFLFFCFFHNFALIDIMLQYNYL